MDENVEGFFELFPSRYLDGIFISMQDIVIQFYLNFSTYNLKICYPKNNPNSKTFFLSENNFHQEKLKIISHGRDTHTGISLIFWFVNFFFIV